MKQNKGANRLCRLAPHWHMQYSEEKEGGWGMGCGGGRCWQHHPTCKYWQTEAATDRFDSMGLKYNGLLENNLRTLDRLGGTVDGTDHPSSIFTATYAAECSKPSKYQSDTQQSQYSVQQNWYCYFFFSVSTYRCTSTSGIPIMYERHSPERCVKYCRWLIDYDAELTFGHKHVSACQQTSLQCFSSFYK